jgi:hypothetical protein
MSEGRRLPRLIPPPAASVEHFAEAVAAAELDRAERWASLAFAVVEAERVAAELEDDEARR